MAFDAQIDVSAIQVQLAQANTAALQALAHEAIEELIALARQGLRWDGSDQTPNAPATIRRKLAQGKPPTPLVDTGLMTTGSEYDVRDGGSTLQQQVAEIWASERSQKLTAWLAPKYEWWHVPETIGGIPLERRFEQLLAAGVGGVAS